MITDRQHEALRCLRTLERANGEGKAWGAGDPVYRTLETKGLAFSELRRGVPTDRGGGWRKRRYGLTPAGRLLADVV